jgi:uncharacterized protein
VAGHTGRRLDRHDALANVLVGFVLIPVMAIVSVVPFVHAGYAAYRVSQGEEYRYPFVADLVEGR